MVVKTKNITVLTVVVFVENPLDCSPRRVLQAFRNKYYSLFKLDGVNFAIECHRYIYNLTFIALINSLKYVYTVNL